MPGWRSGAAAFPIWLGVFSALVVAFPFIVMLGTGAVAISGLAGPVWLIVISLWLALRGEPAARSAAAESAATQRPRST